MLVSRSTTLVVERAASTLNPIRRHASRPMLSAAGRGSINLFDDAGFIPFG
ncbi:MAG TPA: hypothetical protein VF153_00260 [Candidatus Limnocylindria bacterium]